MLTFKEWRNLNESSMGMPFTLGVARPATVGGVVGSTGASDWAEKFKMLEAKKMKKKMFGKDAPEDEEEMGDEDIDLDAEEGGDEDADLDLDLDAEEDDEDMGDEDLGGDEEEDDEEMDLGDEEEGDLDIPAKKKDIAFAKKKMGKAMKKGMKKDDGKNADGCKKCGKMMSKCSCKMMNKGAKKKMTKEETDWWSSVMSMVGTDPNQRNWDGISVKEDSLLPEIDPNALALAQVTLDPKPGEPGYAPQQRIGQM